MRSIWEQQILGLGRSYYQKVDEKNKQTLADYSEYISALNTAIGQRTKDFKGTIKPKLLPEEMVQYLLKSLKVHIQKSGMDVSATKEKALEKLSKFNVKIGYPNKWKDYSKLSIGTSLFENVLHVNKWVFEEESCKTRRSIAYYSPYVITSIVFLLAILQPPFYDYRADAAINFGGIGAQYDGNGNLNNWWTAEDKEKFDASADALVKQFEDIRTCTRINPVMTSVKNELVGSWKLLSYIELPIDGSDSLFPVGKNAEGILMYSPDGFMSVQIMAQDRPPLVSGDRFAATQEESLAVINTFIAFSAAYQILENRVVTYQIKTSLFPNWAETDTGAHL
ncbi:hypothetical protein FQR65_LT17562 [Abscondita terminalis]|nr:hypothetical protein FQR65_LT17562 [Abscondita terminalis]